MKLIHQAIPFTSTPPFAYKIQPVDIKFGLLYLTLCKCSAIVNAFCIASRSDMLTHFGIVFKLNLATTLLCTYR